MNVMCLLIPQIPFANYKVFLKKYVLNNKCRILDAGCGNGILLSMLSQLGHECYGVDYYDCSEEYPNIFLKRKINFATCNIEIDPLPFPDNYFDAVLCGQCLEHFKN